MVGKDLIRTLTPIQTPGRTPAIPDRTMAGRNRTPLPIRVPGLITDGKNRMRQTLRLTLSKAVLQIVEAGKNQIRTRTTEARQILRVPATVGKSPTRIKEARRTPSLLTAGRSQIPLINRITFREKTLKLMSGTALRHDLAASVRLPATNIPMLQAQTSARTVIRYNQDINTTRDTITGISKGTKTATAQDIINRRQRNRPTTDFRKLTTRNKIISDIPVKEYTPEPEDRLTVGCTYSVRTATTVTLPTACGVIHLTVAAAVEALLREFSSGRWPVTTSTV